MYQHTLDVRVGLNAPSTLGTWGIWNGSFTLKKHQIFLSTLRRMNLKTKQSPVILDLCLRKTRAGKSRDYRDVIIFKKLRFQMFSRHSFSAPFSWRISVDGRFGRRNKASFSNFSFALWTLLYLTGFRHLCTAGFRLHPFWEWLILNSVIKSIRDHTEK